MKSVLINVSVAIIVTVGITTFGLTSFFAESNESVSVFMGIITAFILIVPCVVYWKQKITNLFK